jgi:hypothetical protein
MIKANIKNNFRAKKLKQNVRKANFKSVEHAAAAIRLTAIRLIRTGRKKNGKRIPSLPGSPPKRWTNKSGRHIKRSIGYTRGKPIGLNRTAATVYASPENSGDQIYKMHEFGGKQWLTVSRMSSVVDNRKTRYSRNKLYTAYKYRPLAERSQEEQAAIKNYYNNIKVRKKERVLKRSIRASYKPRPFLEPAVQKNLSKIPEIWKSNIKKYFR